MQRQIRRIASPVLIAAAVGGIFWVSAGDLNPPAGTVRPTMKTLTEVEPRIAINATNTPGDATSLFRIIKPGSYYLTGNITGASGKGGIVITSGQVTLDLNGFRLEGVRGTIGIELQCVPDVVIRNGFISNWVEFGILGEDSTGLRIENVHMRNFPFCTVLVGTATVVLDSSINDSADGYQLGSSSRVERCVVRGCTGTAIAVSSSSLVADCTMDDNRGGISIFGDGSVVRNNVIKGTGNGVGIQLVGIPGGNNRIEGNHVTGGTTGLRILSAGNYVAGNTVKGNTDNYDFVAGNQLNILLGEIPESIDWSANVTLAGSLTCVTKMNGITINADDVTLDLNGFALIGLAGAFEGISVPAAISNLTVRNGTIRNFGVNGIGVFDTARNIRIIGVRVLSNFRGILLSGDAHRVTNCTVQGNSAEGILLLGKGCTVTGTTANENGRTGMTVGNGCTVTGNTAYLNQEAGIIAGIGSTVTGNTAFFNQEEGIILIGNSLVDQNTAFNNNQSVGGFPNMSACATCTFGVNHAP